MKVHHKYYVTSAYEAGESGPSNIETGLIDGIEATSIASDIVFLDLFTNKVNVQLENNIIAAIMIYAPGQAGFEQEKLYSSTLKIIQ
jgi:hypothetical protein